MIISKRKFKTVGSCIGLDLLWYEMEFKNGIKFTDILTKYVLC